MHPRWVKASPRSQFLGLPDSGQRPSPPPGQVALRARRLWPKPAVRPVVRSERPASSSAASVSRARGRPPWVSAFSGSRVSSSLVYLPRRLPSRHPQASSAERALPSSPQLSFRRVLHACAFASQASPSRPSPQAQLPIPARPPPGSCSLFPGQPSRLASPLFSLPWPPSFQPSSPAFRPSGQP